MATAAASSSGRTASAALSRGQAVSAASAMLEYGVSQQGPRTRGRPFGHGAVAIDIREILVRTSSSDCESSGADSSTPLQPSWRTMIRAVGIGSRGNSLRHGVEPRHSTAAPGVSRAGSATFSDISDVSFLDPELDLSLNPGLEPGLDPEPMPSTSSEELALALDGMLLSTPPSKWLS